MFDLNLGQCWHDTQRRIAEIAADSHRKSDTHGARVIGGTHSTEEANV
jgi:hypothetical protein